MATLGRADGRQPGGVRRGPRGRASAGSHAEPPAPAGTMFRFEYRLTRVRAPRRLDARARRGAPRRSSASSSARAAAGPRRSLPGVSSPCRAQWARPCAAVRERRRPGPRRLAAARPLAPDHATAALEDLADGCAISLGAMFDGGFYLLAFAQPVPALLERPDDAWQTRDPIGLAAEAAQRSGLAIGLLRTERGLRTARRRQRAARRPAGGRRVACASRLTLACSQSQHTGEWCNGSTGLFGSLDRVQIPAPQLAPAEGPQKLRPQSCGRARAKRSS